MKDEMWSKYPSLMRQDPSFVWEMSFSKALVSDVGDSYMQMRIQSCLPSEVVQRDAASVCKLLNDMRDAGSYNFFSKHAQVFALVSILCMRLLVLGASVRRSDGAHILQAHELLLVGVLMAVLICEAKTMPWFKQMGGGTKASTCDKHTPIFIPGTDSNKQASCNKNRINRHGLNRM